MCPCICLLTRYLKNGSSDFNLLLHTNYILVDVKMINFWTRSNSRWPPHRADPIKHTNGHQFLTNWAQISTVASLYSSTHTSRSKRSHEILRNRAILRIPFFRIGIQVGRLWGQAGDKHSIWMHVSFYFILDVSQKVVSLQLVVSLYYRGIYVQGSSLLNMEWIRGLQPLIIQCLYSSAY